MITEYKNLGAYYCDGLIENLTPRLEGRLMAAYVKMAQELSPQLAVPAT